MRKLFLPIFTVGLLSTVNAQNVGIGTETPTTKLDINGDLRVREIPNSTSTDDITLVTDSEGVVKKKLNEVKGIFRGYLKTDFVSTTGLKK